MNRHKDARLTVHSRALLVHCILHADLRPEGEAEACGVSVRTAYKWLSRCWEFGVSRLENRSSRPHRTPHATSAPVLEQIKECRRKRQTYLVISKALGIGHSTISRLTRAHSLNCLCRLDPPKNVIRYEYDQPGGLLNLHIKKLGNFLRPGHRTDAKRRGNAGGGGWGYVHVAINDHSRVAYSSAPPPNEQKETTCQALLGALEYYASLGITFKRFLTDNGACYRSTAFAKLLKSLGIKQMRTKPHAPRINGNAERFIQTGLREWAYAREYVSSDQRNSMLTQWLHHSNWHRPHMGIRDQSHISRVLLSG